MHEFRWGLVLVASVALGSGCRRYPKSPEEALQRIEQVVTSADALAAWDLVDPETRNAAASVFSDERTAQTIVKAKYPAAEAAAELQRLAAADEPDAAHFFSRTCTAWAQLEGYRKRLGSVSGPIKTRTDGTGAMWVARGDGMPFHVAIRGNGWAWTDLRGEWQLEKDRASHAVQTVRDNAALYQKAQPQ